MLREQALLLMYSITSSSLPVFIPPVSTFPLPSQGVPLVVRHRYLTCLPTSPSASLYNHVYAPLF